MLVGATIQTASFGLAQLIVGRIVTSVGNGMNTSTIPVWQSEMAPPKVRGFLVLFEGAFYCWNHACVLAELWIMVCNPVWLVSVALSHRIPGSVWRYTHSASLVVSRVTKVSCHPMSLVHCSKDYPDGC
jgi:MFS family permease